MDEEAVVRNKADVIMERKLGLVKEQGRIVLSPKMRDLHLLTQMLFTTDTAINRMRMNAGTARIPLSGLQAAHERIVKFTGRVRAFTSALGGSGFFVAPGSNPLEKGDPRPEAELLRLHTEDRRGGRDCRPLRKP